MPNFYKDKTPLMLLLFFLMIGFVAFSNGVVDSILGNYYKEVYNVTPVQRGFIEIPRELPGILCSFFFALLSFLSDIKVTLVGSILAVIGLFCLGMFTPSFMVMMVFLFIHSIGMHLATPLSDAICMDLSEPDKVGARMGQYVSVKSAAAFLASLLVFLGFRSGIFTFSSEKKIIFFVAMAAYFFACVMCVIISVKKKQSKASGAKSVRFIFRKHYLFYYTLTTLHGVQKQIALVYGSWVVIDILMKGADTIALLLITSSFICTFIMRYVGRMIDRFGIKNMLFFEALFFIGVYSMYGATVWAIDSGPFGSNGFSVFLVYIFFVLDRMSMQLGMIKAVYMRSIAIDAAEITSTLSTGITLDHILSLPAAMVGGYIWAQWGSHWVFLMAALFSFGNLFVAWKVNPEKEIENAQKIRNAQKNSDLEL